MKKIPIEVELVHRVRNCETCAWFWGDIPPYGNFPVFDWNEDYPKEVRNQQASTEKYVVKDGPRGKICGFDQVEPGIMHGCRKAPIMTIGINPNMTSYFTSINGAQWSYPKFENDERYAYYYRHHNVYQETIDIELIKRNIIKGTSIIAQYNGEIINVERSADHRWALLTLKYDSLGVREQEVSWSDKERFVIVARGRFIKGDTLGGKIKAFTENDIQLYENGTGYYQRYVTVLEEFKRKVGGDLLNSSLSISEDVAQHDMIGCASPGWSSKYDIPRERITRNCVFDNAWLLHQLVQSKPSIIVLVGKSSLEMFGNLFAQYLGGFDYFIEEDGVDGVQTKVIKEVFHLLKDTVDREIYLHIKTNNFEMRSRLVVSPHFSYDDNFHPHARLSEHAWMAFRNDFRSDAENLIRNERVKRNTWNNMVSIKIQSTGDTIQNQLSSTAWDVLLAYYFDPIDMLASVLEKEYRAGRLQFDQSIGRLKRSGGPCHFCNNDEWVFPEGCEYGKDAGKPIGSEYYKKVVDEIIKFAES